MAARFGAKARAAGRLTKLWFGVGRLQAAHPGEHPNLKGGERKMENVYESPELFELGNAEELTLSCSCGTGSDCDCKAKAALMDMV